MRSNLNQQRPPTPEPISWADYLTITFACLMILWGIATTYEGVCDWVAAHRKARLAPPPPASAPVIPWLPYTDSTGQPIHSRTATPAR